MAKTRSATNTYVSCEQMGCMGRRRSPGCSLQTSSLMNFDPQCSLPARNSCEKTPDKKTGRRPATTGPQLAELVWWCVWSPRSPSRDRLVGKAAGTTTCFPSPTRGNSQGTVEEGARPGAKAVGYAQVNCCITEQLEIIDVYLYRKYGCFHSAFMLLCHLQGRATPSEAKPVSKWARSAIQ